MGIKGLNKFLKDKCPEAFIFLPANYFRGKRIAIDSDNILRRFMNRAHKEIVDKTDVVIQEPDRTEIIKTWISHVKYYVIGLLKNGITPIFVFDGKYISEKSKTQEKRREDRRKKIQEAENFKHKVLLLDELERTPAMVTELRKKMHHLGGLNRDEKEMIMSILSAVGLPVLKAKGEGEQLCAMLCIEGKVSAVHSTDTDLVAFGCPLVITDHNAGYLINSETGKQEESYKCTFFKPILSKLNMTYDSFRDLCIMSGCDFNDNIYRVGISTSYKLLVKCQKIESLPEKYDSKKECLNHERCREIMGHYDSSEICQDEIIININKDLSESRDILEMYSVYFEHGANEWLQLSSYYRYLPDPPTEYVIKKPSLQRSRLRINLSGSVKKINQTQKPSPKKLRNKQVVKLNQYLLNKYKNE